MDVGFRNRGPRNSHLREVHKISREEAARQCGLHRTYYNGVEHGVLTLYSIGASSGDKHSHSLVAGAGVKESVGAAAKA